MTQKYYFSVFREQRKRSAWLLQPTNRWCFAVLVVTLFIRHSPPPSYFFFFSFSFSSFLLVFLYPLCFCRFNFSPLPLVLVSLSPVLHFHFPRISSFVPRWYFHVPTGSPSSGHFQGPVTSCHCSPSRHNAVRSLIVLSSAIFQVHFVHPLTAPRLVHFSRYRATNHKATNFPGSSMEWQ
jgi:hypothetical protein